MKRLVFTLTVLGLVAGLSPSVRAFCGFYVGKADTTLFNDASKVVLVRDGDRTVLTMSNDYRGDLTEFAMVIPVPTFITREQIHVADPALIDHLDAYSAPRLVEYFDQDPCRIYPMEETAGFARRSVRTEAAVDQARARSLGVTVEASYTVGEYDILILSARESDGLETWLTENGYRVPKGASAVLGSYLRQNMRFFVAKVNLEEQSRTGSTYLRPLQVAYESPKFMLPIRLGMVNADGPQELYVFALTRTGRIETTNYRTVRLPSDVTLPTFLKDGNEFAQFYRAMFDEQVKRERMRAVFLEYAWDMGWCDPCAADPLTTEELRELGVFWLDAPAGPRPIRGPGPVIAPTPQNVFVTRLHLRYDNAHFPEDLVFQETGDRSNFQGRYVMQHPWIGSATCPAAQEYRSSLAQRFDREAQQLASLTGWPLEDIRRKVEGRYPNVGQPEPDAEPWWRRIWRK